MAAGPLVKLTDVRDFLNVRGDSNDGELAAFLGRAVSAIEDQIGPLTPQSVTEEKPFNGPVVVLGHTPTIAVQTVMVERWFGAPAVDDTSAWRLNAATGVLRRTLNAGTAYYLDGTHLTVTYTFGRSAVPDPVNQAVLTQVAGMWKSQRGAAATRTQQQGNQPGQAYPGVEGFLLPDVLDLLVPYLPGPKVA